MTEAEILQRLKPGSWVSKPERKALEAMLAQMRVNQQARPQVQVPVAASSGDIDVSGSPAFVKATRRAIDALKETPSWFWARHLRSIRESPNDDGSIAGYVSGGIFTVMRNAWNAGTKEYASFFVHEGTHAARGHAIGIEEEKIAYANQVQALKEMGASWWTIRRYEKHAANPTHNFSYAPQ